VNGRTCVRTAAVAVLVASASAMRVHALEAQPGAIACTSLAIDPPQVRLTRGDQVSLHASGGGGLATFAIASGVDAGGASIERGGALHAGDQDATFDVIARDDACRSQASARVSVVAPLDVEPREAHVAAGGTFRFAVHGGAGIVHARLLDDARGATLGDDGVFAAPRRDGRWRAIVTDSGSPREIVVAIDVVSKLAPLRARVPIVGVPSGGRVPLAWTGGSGAIDVRVDPASAGAVERNADGALLLALLPGEHRSLDVRAVDRVTHEERSLHVVLSDPLGDGGDHAGSTVSFARVGAVVQAFVADAAVPGRRRIERFDLRAPDAPTPDRHDEEPLGASAPVEVDFDGDGVLELAIADPHVWPKRLAPGEVDPEGCLAQTGLDGVGGGLIHVYARQGDRFVERARLVAGRAPGRRPDAFGLAFAVADVDGDGKGDLVVSLRRDQRVVETVLGRRFVPGKILIACHQETGPEASLSYPPSGAPWSGSWGDAIGTIGDVDGDGCDEVALTASHEGRPTGTVVAFGYDAVGGRCRGHSRPQSYVVVSTDREWEHGPTTLYRPGAPRLDLGVRWTGRVFARGEGDLTGDGIADLVLGDDELDDETGRGPAVEIISGRFLASFCPNHACRDGADARTFVQGDLRFAALSALGPKDRIVLRGDAADRGFGGAVAIADLDGDHQMDLAIGAPDGFRSAPFAGDVSVFKGPFVPSSNAVREPWALAVGDPLERSSFGGSIAVVRSEGVPWLLVGAPRSLHGGKVADVGAAYLFRLDGSGK
jgi:hypothetical protein